MRNMILALLACSSSIYFSSAHADETKPKESNQKKEADTEPAKMQLKFNVTSYGFLPVKKDYSIDQPSPSTDFEMTLERKDYRMPFGEKIPGWVGTKDAVLKDGYRLRIKASYLKGEPKGDFKSDKHGLSLDVSYFYEKNLIGFQTITKWTKPDSKSEVTAELKDIAYFGLLSSNDFDLPSMTDGYGEGFRAWVAVRDGLKKRNKKDNDFDSLSDFLKPLARKDNLMIPTVTVTAKVKQAK